MMHFLRPQHLLFWAGLLLSGLFIAPQASALETVDIVRQTGPSVVAVHVTLHGRQPHSMPDAMAEEEVGGSGFVIDHHGHIITNFHVLADALEEHSVDLLPDAEISVSYLDSPDLKRPVRILGARPDYDLALLELTDLHDIPAVAPLRLGDSSLVEAGQDVTVIGSPFGLHSSVTTGIVSAIERQQPGLLGIEMPFIQTDAAINPGNSGGPLLNDNGEVIGIISAMLAPAGGPQTFLGVAFAIPINLLQESLGDLFGGGISGIAAELANLPEGLRLGMDVSLSVEDYPPSIRHSQGLPKHGLVIMEVTPGGPADQAGLEASNGPMIFGNVMVPQGRDIVIGINEHQLHRPIDLQLHMLEAQTGEAVTLKVWRDGEERDVDVVAEALLSDQGVDQHMDQSQGVD